MIRFSSGRDVDQLTFELLDSWALSPVREMEYQLELFDKLELEFDVGQTSA